MFFSILEIFCKESKNWDIIILFYGSVWVFEKGEMLENYAGANREKRRANLACLSHELSISDFANNSPTIWISSADLAT